MSVGARAARQFGPAERPPPGRSPERAPAPPSAAQQVALGVTFVVAVVAAVLTWAAVVERLRDPGPIATRGTPAALVWSDRVFRSEAELAAWLRRKGVNYEAWARTHPAAVSILRKRDRAAVAASSGARPAQTSGAAARRAPGREPEAVPAPAGPVEAPGSGITPLVALAVIVTGVAAVAFGLSHRLRLGSAAAAAATGVVRGGPAGASLVPAAAARVPVALRFGRRAGVIVAGVAPFLLGLARRIVLVAIAHVLVTLRRSRDLALFVADRLADALRVARRAVVVASAGATEAVRLVRRLPVRRFWGVVSERRLDLGASAIALSVGLVVAVLLR